jgi:ubiquitin carboxyl-terminal hydrolase 1
MSDYGYPSFDVSERRWAVPESTTSSISVVLATVVGAYILAKGLELSGFPVRPRLRQAMDMATRALHIGGASSSHFGNDNKMRRLAGGLLYGIESLYHRGARSVSSFTEALSSGPSDVPPGLRNTSNSCYQNSVIQGMAALPSLREYLSQIAGNHLTFTPDTTNGALHELLSMLNDPENRGRSFWIPDKLRTMSTFTQQDAQEYYSKVLDELDTEIKKASTRRRRSSVSWLEATKNLADSPAAADETQEKVERSEKPQEREQSKLIPNPLDGLIAQRVGCTVCGYSEGLSLINFNCVTVSVGSSHYYDIRDCLDEYTRLEYIDGVECAKCTLLKLQKTLTPLAKANPGSPYEKRLNAVLEMLDDEKFEDNTLVKTLNIPKKNWVQSSKSKQIVVARAPKSLVLHVNRSIFDETTGEQYKNTALVSYPSTLDFGAWCLGSAPSGSRQPDISLEEWPRDPKQSMLSLNHEKDTDSPFQYRLRAAVTHSGTHGYGHYVCYRPHARLVTESAEDQEDEVEPPGEQWWRFSDDNVYAVSEGQAHQGNVFMLFYERIDEDPTSQPPEALPTTIAESAPLPPQDVRHTIGFVVDEDAATVPLPDDDDILDDTASVVPDVQLARLPPASLQDDELPAATLTSRSPPQTLSPTLAPPPPYTIAPEPTNHDMETDISEAESEDAPSTQLTSDSEAEFVSPPTPKPFVPVSPHLMRTAGNASARGQGSRQSLPMVSPT